MGGGGSKHKFTINFQKARRFSEKSKKHTVIVVESPKRFETKYMRESAIGLAGERKRGVFCYNTCVSKLKTNRDLYVSNAVFDGIIFAVENINDRKPYCVKCEQVLMALVLEDA